MNDTKGLSGPVFLFVTWGVLALASVAFWGGITALLGAEQGEINAAALFGAVVGVPGGLFFALVALLMRFGIRGWRQTYSEARDSYQEQAASMAQPYPVETQPKEIQENTFGCCEDRLTTDGFVIHGGPDCHHPDADLYRDFY